MLSDRTRVSLDGLELLLLTLVTPILLFPRGAWPWISLVLPALWIVERTFGRPIFPSAPSNALVCGLAVMAVLSTAASIDPNVGWPKLAALMLGIAAYIVLLRVFSAPGRLIWLIRLHLLAGMGLSAAVILGTAWINKWPMPVRVTAVLPTLIRGLPGAEEGFHPNAGAGSLVLFMPIAFTAMSVRTLDPSTRRLAALAMIVTGATIVLTQSRGGLLAIPIGLFLLYTITRRSRVGLALLGASVVVAAVLLSSPEWLSRVIPRVAGPNVDAVLASRVEVWARTIDFVAEHPWFGVGFNGLRHQIQAEQPLFLTEPYQDPVHAHNQLLQTAADLGVVGLVVYTALWVVSILILVRTVRAGESSRTGESARARLAAGVLLALLAHFVFGIADAIPLGAKVGVTYWLTLALATRVSGATAVEMSPPCPTSRL